MTEKHKQRKILPLITFEVLGNNTLFENWSPRPPKKRERENKAGKDVPT